MWRHSHEVLVARRTRQAPALGALLKTWRGRRGLSQLALGLHANVSARHLSFVESGRSRPTREMVMRLAAALQVPLREQNVLLEAAGFAPVYRETELSEPEMRQARKAIDLILERQNPYPAVVMDRHWNIVHANDGAKRFFTRLLGKRKASGPANVVRMVFDQDYLRPLIVNWADVASALIQRVHREAVGGVLDETSTALLREVTTYPGVGDAIAQAPREATQAPVIPLHFHKGELDLSFFSTVTTLGTPRDVALQELRIECFFPADRSTERGARRSY